MNIHSMKKNLLLLLLFTGGLSACNNSQQSPKEQAAFMNNPLLDSFATPHQVPPFELIKESHYSPAIVKGIELANADISKITNNKENPNFQNTIVALDRSASDLVRILSVFYNLLSANTNDKMQAIAQEISPLVSKFEDDKYLNEVLFSRVKMVWENKDALQLNTEDATLLDKTYKAFVRSGANLNAENKKRLRTINEELSILSLKYSDNILKETNDFKLVIDNKEDLAGLPTSVIEAAAELAKEQKMGDNKWVFSLQSSSVMPFLQYASNRALRKKIWEAYQKRGNNDNANDNKNIIVKLANLRSEKAQLLGYKDYASYSLEESMAKTPENVYKLINQLWKPALAKSQQESADIKKMMLADGVADAVQPYDWRYYTEKIRKQKYDLDEQELKPYFSLENVRNGVFMVTEKLFGLKFKQVDNIPVYHKDVTAWEVSEADGRYVGLLYMDFHPRESKSGGAWMTSYREQKMENGKRVPPIISIVCNFTPATASGPSLLTFEEVTTFFHEFGHALHGLLSNVNYQSLAGTSVSRDFVELPSQVMENWAADPAVLKMYAKHYKTGAVIPDALIQKIINTGTFDQGFATVEYLAASLLDLNYHTITGKIDNVNTFEATAVQKMGLSSDIIPRYRSTYFNHIFGGGYAAGYYSYIWSGVLDTDAFDAFKSTSLFNPEKAMAFRKNILEKGGTDDPQKLYKAFRGQDPSINALLRKRGLDAPNKLNTVKN